MKKVTSTFFMCLTFLVYASGQYNKVFYNATISTGAPTGELPVDIVDAGNGNTCVLARNWGIISLKELDFSGNVICSETFSVNTANQAFGGEKLLRAPNGDYLVGGRYYQGTILNPFVARFQKDPGNPAKFICTWFYMYPSNNTGNMGLGRRYSELNIVRAEDDPIESYIIATDGDASNTPIVGSTSIVNAFKISANGTLIWNKKYYDNSGSVADVYVHALCYGHVSEAATTKKYLIAGAADKGDRTFFLTIDGSGNIVNQYREYDMPGDEYLHDAIYDVATSEFILTNTTNSPLRNSLSQVAINKISFIGMGFTQTDFYFENDLASTNCFSSAGRIREDATNTYYLIGGYANKDFNGTGIEHAGPTILKIDKSSNVQFYKRYNRLGLGAGTGIASVVDPGGTENYAVCAIVAAGPSDNSRVFTTNTSGITCGEEDLVYDQSNALFTPADYILSQASMSGRMLAIPTAGGSFQERNCDPTNPEYRLATSLSTVSNEYVKAYPSVLSSNDRTVTLDLSVSKVSNLTVILSGTDGRAISRQHYKVNPSDSKLKFDCGIEVPGTYILTIESNNHELRHRMKISKL